MALDLQIRVETKDPTKWLDEATAKAKKLAGSPENYLAADLFIFQPSSGRWFAKSAGSLTLVAHG